MALLLENRHFLNSVTGSIVQSIFVPFIIDLILKYSILLIG